MIATFLIAFLFIFSPRETHPFHASVCEIEYNEESQSLEIAYRMFLDDLENAINQKFEAGLDIFHPDQKERTDQLTEEYLKQQFKFRVNGRSVELQYLGSEIEGYALWCYIEIVNVPTPKTIEIENRVMFELFDDQINLIHFNRGDQVRSLKLVKNRGTGLLMVGELWE